MTETSGEANKARILLVEDSPSLAAVYKNYLTAEGYITAVAINGKEAFEQMESNLPELVLLDLKLPDMSGMDVLQYIHQQSLPCAVIIITAHGSVDTAIEAMRLGAVDFITKPFNSTRLRVTVGNALEKRRLSKVASSYQQALERVSFHGFIGGSMPMQAVYRIIESAAPSKATVFITGESGTGKELCAEAIHNESPRKAGSLIALNCAAIPRDLMESEIFGHVKGAFTGAVGCRDGAATLADGGTLFLDEVCETDIELQSKLLRFIQTGRFQRVGSNKEEEVDIRIVCATNRDPLEEVRAGRFREDLYYRLNVIPLFLPPLRNRGDDILMIAVEMLRSMAKEEDKNFCGFSSEVQDRLIRYLWPGNVRELQNAVRNVVVLNNAEQVEHSMLPDALRLPETRVLAHAIADSEAPRVRENHGELVAPNHLEKIRPLWLEERELIERSIDICGGSIPKAAAMLEISASTIYRKRMLWEKNEAELNGDSQSAA